MKADKKKLTNHILQTIEEIYKMFGPAVPEEWLSSDITVTQLRILLILYASGPLKMSDIAAKLNVTLPTATVIVSNLVRKNLVERVVNPDDRRLVIGKLTPEGKALIDKIWGYGRFAVEVLLQGLSPEQLQNAADLADYLLINASNMKQSIQ